MTKLDNFVDMMTGHFDNKDVYKRQESEMIFTKWLIIVSSVLAFIVGILSANIKLIGYVICLSWQQPLFMMLIYYLPLKNRFKKGTEIAHTEL